MENFPSRSGRRGLVAVVLGTALSALGPATSEAATVRAVNDLSRYCTVCWRHARLDPDSWPDCTQEVLMRLVERVTPEAWGGLLKEESQERREFLRAIDTVKKRCQRRRRATALPADAVADRRALGERQRAEDREAVRRAASRLLSERQRRILHMSLEGWPVHEVATALNLSADRVSDEKYKAIRKLRQALAERQG